MTAQATPGNWAVEVERLVRVFQDFARGDILAVDGLSFRVRRGEIYGLLGPNGAGKTTTLRCLATLLEPTGGSVLVEGMDPRESPREVRERVGFLSAGMGLPARLTVREVLEFFGLLYGLSRDALGARIQWAIDEFGLRGLENRPAERLSTGLKQRLSLARATLHNPPVLLLDEATSGLDPLVARRVREAISRLRDRGHAIVFSTHVMSEAAILCDRIGIISNGRLIAEGTQAELCGRTGTHDLENAFVALAGTGDDGEL